MTAAASNLSVRLPLRLIGDIGATARNTSCPDWCPTGALLAVLRFRLTGESRIRIVLKDQNGSEHAHVHDFRHEVSVRGLLGARRPDGDVRGTAALHAVVRPFGNQLRCEIGEWPGEEDPALVQRALRTVTVGAAARPDTPVSLLPLLEAEEEDLLTDWNRTERPLPENPTIHGLFERQAERTPLSVAVIDGDRTMTYSKLNACANRLAHLLRRLGTVPDTPVGLCLSRSADTLVALLAVLKSGGAYVPLDPRYPVARIDHMVTDSQSPLLVTDRIHTDRTDARGRRRLILEDALELAGAEDDTNPAPAAGPDDLAYVMYTSGTTGAPKGVEVEHRSVVNLLLALRDLVELDNSDHLLAVTSLSFDISVFELLGPLIVGARLTIAEDGDTRDGHRLGKLLEASGATIMQATPTTWRMLLKASGRIPPLKVMCGGEPMPSDLARDLRRHTDDLWNVYGPTETTVWSTAARIGDADVPRPPVGTPLANTRVYVLDKRLRPLPIGAVGELHIGGVGVTRGYRGRTDLTAERFLTAPWDAEERMYRTGDLARFRSDGRLEILGRMDGQVKIAGHRIETGEVEAHLRDVAGVRDAVVIAKDGAHGRELAAYVEWSDTARPSEHLRSALSESLPSYMLPTRYTPVSRIPVLPNGKVDRAELASDQAAKKTSDRTVDGPERHSARSAGEGTTPLERVLAEQWCDLLGLPEVRPEDDFFTLGGTSLKAGAFINSLETLTGHTVFVSALFDHPTLAGFCAFLEADYPEAFNLLTGTARSTAPGRPSEPDRPVDAHRLRVFRHLVTGPVPEPSDHPRLAPAAFVLSAPRSGSTLLRTMLAGNEQLFAPPELELLGFDSMDERTLALSGRNAHDGLERAFRELLSCAPETARRYVEDRDRHQSTFDVYSTMQGLAGKRLLVDKTTTYATNRSALDHAEQLFDGARYIHLTRHPAAMIHSYQSMRLEQVFRHHHSYSSRELAELIWLVSNSNIASFFRSLPEDRCMVLRFEDLLTDPEGRMRAVADFLGVEFDPLMVDPYSGFAQRMTDGLYPDSRMAGDPKLRTYDRLRPDVAEAWRDSFDLSTLSPLTHFVANGHGYETVKKGPEKRSSERRPVPVSAHQRGIYLHQRVSDVPTLYNICRGWRIRGELEPLALGRALDQVVQRHTALRSTIRLVDGEPDLFIGPVSGATIDHMALPNGDSESGIATALEEYAASELDLENGPAFRAGLLRVNDRDHVLALLVHHALVDGSSLAVVLREIAEAYRAAVDGSPWAPPAPVQHVDLLGGEAAKVGDSEKDLAYWRSAFAQAPPLLTLPSTRERPTVRRFRGGRVPMRLEGNSWQSILNLARSAGATPFITLLAAFKAMMRRYTQSSENDRIVVGTAFAKRDGADDVVGMFTGTLPLITSVDDTSSFRELLAEVRRTCSEAFEHHDVSFEALISELGGERDASLSPLLQVLFTLEPQLTEEIDLPDAELEDVDITWRTSKFDLTVSAVASENRLSGWWEYDQDLFDSELVQRAAGHYVRLLTLIAADPDRAIGDYEFLSPEENERAIHGWNRTTRVWERDEPLETAIRRHARTAPGSVAVEGSGQRMTYAQLDNASDELAARLQAEGLASGDIAPVLTDRSPMFVTACLAVMKCGAAYLPIDPSTPDERIAFIIRDSDARLAVTTTNEQKRIPEGVLRLLTDRVGEERVGPATDVPISGTDPAYVIYTSGSTGRPKGVVVERRSLENFVRWYSDELRLVPEDKCVQAVNLGFDAAVMDLWPTLAAGATLTIASGAELTDPRRMWQWIAETEATAGFIVTPVLEAMLAEPHVPVDRIRLRTVVTGGDRLHPQRMDKFPFRLINGYGPTETTILATTAPVQSSADDPRAPAIGRPVPNTTCYVLDRRMRPVPGGVEGELYIGGVQVARGYLNHPELTRKRFLPDPFDKSPHARLFRSGDRVRQRPDGTLEFLGRVDGQVKIRGFRIELGEIESALVRIPGVREAAVVVAGSGADQRLHAFVTGSENITRDTVCDELGRVLPAYMLPTTVVRLDEMPRTPNGKTDRRALAEMPVPAADTVSDAPPTELESQLLKLWQHVLDRTGMGVGDSFFEFGGHSLNAMRLLSEVHEVTGHELTIPELFSASSPRAVARLLGDGTAPWSRSALVELRSGTSEAPLVCVHPSDGSILHYQPLERLCGPSHPVWALRAKPGLPYDSVEDMADAYLDEILAKAGEKSPPHLLGWSFGGLVTFEMARRLEEAGTPAASVVLLDSEPLTGTVTESEEALLAEFARQLSRRSGHTGVQAPSSWDELFDQAREHRWIEPSVRERELQNAFSTFRHHVKLGRRYEPIPIATPLHVYIASDRDQPLRQAQIRAWERLSTAGLSLGELEGDHFDAVAPGHLERVVKDLGLAGEAFSGKDER